jgi:hypothetical protein
VLNIKQSLPDDSSTRRNEKQSNSDYTQDPAPVYILFESRLLVVLHPNSIQHKPLKSIDLTRKKENNQAYYKKIPALTKFASIYDS